MPRALPAKPRKRPADDSVFLNVPYDSAFSPQFLAYLCGICAFGLIPRVTLEIQGGSRRLDRIVKLIEVPVRIGCKTERPSSKGILKRGVGGGVESKTTHERS
jgi:hypothetical protein